MTPQPFTRFIMLGAMRSGSILLEKFLNQYAGIVCHGELFHKAFIGVQGCTNYLGVSLEARDKNPDLLLQAVQNKHPGKITGFRFFQDHDKRVMHSALKDPNCAKIILTRDPLESFVSLQIALKTQQWLVSDVAHRKQAQIHFDLDAYARYLEYRNDYYSEIRRALAASEQPYFEIDYSALTEVENINRLAAFIGDRRGKTALHEPIKKQNPGPLADKIINIEEVRAALDAPALQGGPTPAPRPVLESGTDLSRVYFCHNQPLALAPIPAVPDGALRRWMQARNSDTPPENGFSRARFISWQQQHRGGVLFSVVRHPVRRAYNAFMHKIFATTGEGYLSIRKQLEDQFGMFLPQGEISPDHDRATLEQGGYGAAEHRISFKLFLVFVAANLKGETKIRQDGKWQVQTELLRRYRVLHPGLVTFTEGALEAGLAYLENRLNLPPQTGWQPEPPAAYAFPLSEIYDAEAEALTRAAYGPDYQAFAFGDYRQSAP